MLIMNLKIIFVVSLVLGGLKFALADVYTFDHHNRLSSVDYGNGFRIIYSYDRAGNIISKLSLGNTAPAHYAKNNVPVWWLNKHGFTHSLDAVTEIDVDGDGWTVAEEWIANTDPTDPNSTLGFSEFLVSENGTTIDLSWRAETGRMYRLEQSTNLQSWTPVVGLDNIVGYGEAVNFQLTNLHSDKLFFRIVVWKP